MQTEYKQRDQADTKARKLTATSRSFSEVRRPFPSGVHSSSWLDVDTELRSSLTEAINARRFPIYVFGAPGRGKSCALASLFVSYDSRERAVPQWIQLEEFCRQIIKCRTSRDGKVEVSLPGGKTTWRSESDWIRIVCATPVLFVDDIGIRPPTDTGLEIAYKLINQRSSLEPTFYSSNLSPEQLRGIYDARIVSRVCQGTVIRLGGEDRRLSNAKYVDLF